MDGKMIVVTRLNDSQFAINPDLIERIHQAPDTTIVMVDGGKYIVTESMPEIIEMIASYRARVVAMATQYPAPFHQQGSRRMGLATAHDDSTQPNAGEPTPIEHAPVQPTPIQSRKN